MKVVTIFDFEVTWWRLLQSLTLRVSDEGCCNLWLWGYPMKVVTVFDFEGTWWKLFQSLTLRVPDEGCCNLWLWEYLMKVVPFFDFEGTWWSLFQSLTLRVPDEGYSNPPFKVLNILFYSIFLYYYLLSISYAKVYLYNYPHYVQSFVLIFFVKG
jgi:hypothetical protein